MPATEAQIDTRPAGRLVIRIKLIPQERPQPPAWRRSSRSALLIGGAVAIVLSWIGISTFRSDPTPPSPVERAVGTRPPVPAEKITMAKPAEATPVPAEVQQPAEAPPSATNEVLPDVPQSALDTIRGTVRVSVRVIVDQQGRVVGASADDRGPSRYFERLAVQASKRWTFTPATSERQRIMQVRFNFTRDGVKAHASPRQ